MLKSQQEAVFSAGGFLNVNVEAFIAVILLECFMIYFFNWSSFSGLSNVVLFLHIDEIVQFQLIFFGIYCN